MSIKLEICLDSRTPGLIVKDDPLNKAAIEEIDAAINKKGCLTEPQGLMLTLTSLVMRANHNLQGSSASPNFTLQWTRPRLV